MNISVEHQATLASALRLIDALKTGLPAGEAPETIGEFVAVHRRELSAIKQTIGKNVAMLRLIELQRQYPEVPYEGDLLL